MWEVIILIFEFLCIIVEGICDFGLMVLGGNVAFYSVYILIKMIKERKKNDFENFT